MWGCGGVRQTCGGGRETLLLLLVCCLIFREKYKGGTIFFEKTARGRALFHCIFTLFVLLLLLLKERRRPTRHKRPRFFNDRGRSLPSIVRPLRDSNYQRDRIYKKKNLTRATQQQVLQGWGRGQEREEKKLLTNDFSVDTFTPPHTKKLKTKGKYNLTADQQVFLFLNLLLFIITLCALGVNFLFFFL